MNDMIYEEYMRNVLGYNPGYMQDTYQMNNFYANSIYEQNYNEKLSSAFELESLYPEVYSRYYPTVCKVCSQCTEKITSEVLENMTTEVYDIVTNKETRQKETNTTIKDLIKILIIRELIGLGQQNQRPPMTPPRPSYPGPSFKPPRPPYPNVNPR